MGSLIDAYNKGKKSGASSKTNNNTENNNASQKATASARPQSSSGSSLIDAYNRGKSAGGNTSAAGNTAKDTDEPWYKKVARYIDEHTTNDADVTFGYSSLSKGNQTLTETVDKAKAKSEKTRMENTEAAAQLRKTQTADSGGTTFGEDVKDVNDKSLKWWEVLNAEAYNAADATFGTYSPGNAIGRTKLGNTVAAGLQESGSNLSEVAGFVTDQKKDKEPTLAEITFGDDKVEVLPFMKKFWQKISDASYENSDKLAKEAQESKTVAKDGAGTVGSFLVDAGSTATQMAADIGTSAITGINGLIPMAARSFGGGLREARESGASKQEQFNYAVGSAAIEVLTEKIGSVALPFKATYGKGAVDDLIENLVKKSAKTKMGAACLATLFSALSEGGEEILSDVLNPILKTMTYDKTAYKEYGTEEYWSNVLRDGLLGAGLGFVGSGGQIVSAAKNTMADRKASAEQPQTAQEAAKPREASDIVADIAAGKIGAQEPTQQATSAPTMEQVVAAMTGKPFVQTAASVITDNSINAESDNGLPPGMGAASLGFAGEMSPAEQWVAEAQAQGDSALHPISDEQQRNLVEQTAAEFEAEARLIRKRYKDKYGNKLSKEQQQELDSELIEAEKRIRRAPQELPKIDPMGNLTSKMAQTVMNSGVTPQEMSDAILNDAYDGRFSRIAYTDSEAINKAEDEIENGEGRYQGALERWKGAVDRGEVSKDNMVMGICLYNNAVTNGDYTTALDILDGLVVLGKNTGQALQAVRILNKLSPEGRLYVAAKAVDRINRDVKKRYGDKAPDISVDEGLYAAYADALKSGDEARIKSAWEAVEQNIADQIPASWADKLNAFRYLAMLGNPRTHVRNIVGNGGFMPVRVMKNYLAAGIESAVDKVSKDGIARTKAALNPLNANDRALLAVAWQDYQNVKGAILSGGKYNDGYDDYDGVQDKRTIFTSKIGKPVEVLRRANTSALNAEDSWFSQPAYAESLAEYLKANGISAQQYTTEGAVAPEVIAAAQAYAVKEAQKATYRDLNKFSQFISKLGKTNIKAVNVMVEAILPFKKTPANILARAVEYSPVGLAKTLSADTIRLKNGKITAAEFIDNLSSGLVGTALVGLGMLLAKHGVLLGGADDDDKQQSFNELRGKQNYSINVGDTTITLDWLAPESMPLFVGVSIWESFSDDERDGNVIENAFEAIANIAMPIFDMSMLQGVNDLLEGLRYVSDGKGIMKLFVDAAANYLSQYIPTLGGQIERVIETQREQTFIDRSEDAPSSAAQYKIGSILNKIPGVDYNQIPYIDAWGRTEETGGVAERMFNNLINPAYVKKSGETWVDDELQRLYDLGETGVFPQKAAQDTKINGEYLSADEYVAYAKERGSTSLNGVQELIRSSAYKNMSDADKAAAIKNVYAYADGVAKLKVNRNAEVESWISKAKDSGNPSQYITDQIYLKSVDSDGNGSSTSADKVRGLINGGYSGDKLISKVREYMTSESGNCELADLLEKTQSANIDDNIALDVYEFKNSANNDKNADGKVTKSVKDKVKEYIGSLSIPAEQKNALYYSLYKKW